jgi:hypothetical protein
MRKRITLVFALSICAMLASYQSNILALVLRDLKQNPRTKSKAKINKFGSSEAPAGLLPSLRRGRRGEPPGVNLCEWTG